MLDFLDQLPVYLKHLLVGWLPLPLQTLGSILLTTSAILLVFPLLFALTTWLERKGLGRIQNRPGPNRVGPNGLLQPVADGLKTLWKEDLVPRAADRLVHFLAPVVLVISVLMGYAVLPVGRNMAALDLDVGLLFFFATGAGAELAVFMAGWSSRNKYSLLGGARAIAQMISYELPLIASALVVVMATGSLSLTRMVEAQSGYSFGIPHWHVFTPWGAAGFLIFLIAATAEANRSPFDIPEGESEIIAGYYLEYSGFKFALFFLGEYLGLFAMSGVAITLFLGGWHAPLSLLQWIPSWLWFFIKLFSMIALFIWMRGTLPRLRVDQLMHFAWKFLLPLALINLPAFMLWDLVRSSGLPSAGILAWILPVMLLVGSYRGLARQMAGQARVAPRVYRYADS